MLLADFAPLIQLSAGINIAYIAVEYNESYTKLLIDRFFNLEQYVEDQFMHSSLIVGDDETISNLEPVTINGIETTMKILEIQSEHSNLKKEINECKNSLMIEAGNYRLSKNFASLSLWSFLFCLVMLFIVGVENEQEGFYGEVLKSFFFVLSCITILYFLVGWFFECKAYRSLKKTVILFFLSLAICIGISLIKKDISPIYETARHLFCLVIWLPFLNFIAYYFITTIKVKKIKKKIKKKAEEMNEKSDKLQDSISSILTTNQLSLELQQQNGSPKHN